MRYAKIAGVGYCRVEEREGGLWAVAGIAGPEEDPMPAGTLEAGPLAGFRLLPPVRPPKIVCVGRNYRDHAAEMGDDVPKEPMLFLKATSSLLGSGEEIVRPEISSRVDFEGELGVVMGKRCRNLGPEEDVRPYIRGYTIVNDVTARDLQKSDGQWTRGKGYDTFCPVGPVVSDEIDPVSGAAVTVTTRLNGKMRQSGSTQDLLFTIAQVLRFATTFMTLEAGDLIPTGTPAGVGPIQVGDVVEVAIAGLGMLRNGVVRG